jgi:hypothetical protein
MTKTTVKRHQRVYRARKERHWTGKQMKRVAQLLRYSLEPGSDWELSGGAFLKQDVMLCVKRTVHVIKPDGSYWTVGEEHTTNLPLI